MAAMSGEWLCRKVRHPWEGGPHRLTMYFATLDCATSKPSLSNSPWIRGAPTGGLSTLVRGMRGRRSASFWGGPQGGWVFHRQYRRKPARCQRTRVSGRMIVMALRTDGNNRYSWTKNKRSPFVSRTRPCTLRRSTISWCRSAAFSASSRLFDLNGETDRVRKSQKSAIIAVDVRRFGRAINTDQVFGTHRIRDRPTSYRSSWQNGYIERLIGSIRRERTII